MEKKVKVEVGGRIVRVMPHMLNDMNRFGATQIQKVVKETPRELIKAVEKAKEIKLLPEMKITKAVEVIPDKVPEPEPEVKTRKAPVRSKSKTK